MEGVVRRFDVSEFLGAVAQMEVGADASPSGIGCWLALNGVILRYFAAPITPEHTELFAHRFGHCEGQQTWEALAILVAARIWQDSFCNRRVSMRVRGDNVGALTLVVKMRPSTKQQAIISRELALITCKAAFPPAVLHTPGIAHKLADQLSRIDDPKAATSCEHSALANAVRTEVPVRTRSWNRALDESPS